MRIQIADTLGTEYLKCETTIYPRYLVVLGMTSSGERAAPLPPSPVVFGALYALMRWVPRATRPPVLWVQAKVIEPRGRAMIFTKHYRAPRRTEPRRVALLIVRHSKICKAVKSDLIFIARLLS